MIESVFGGFNDINLMIYFISLRWREMDLHMQ